MKQLVIGIDQSYADTGVAIAVDGVLKWIDHYSFKGCTIKADKRIYLAAKVAKLCRRFQDQYDVAIVVEGIRLFSGQDIHISRAYLSGAYAMLGSLVDMATQAGVPIYCIETRSWKKAVLGSSKNSSERFEGVKDQKKVESVKYIINAGFKRQITSQTRNGKVKYNDNMADAGCIALSYFRSNNCKSLEEF